MDFSLLLLLIYSSFLTIAIAPLVVIYPLLLRTHQIPTPMIGLTFTCYGVPLLLNCCHTQFLRSKFDSKCFIYVNILLYSTSLLLICISSSTHSHWLSICLSFLGMLALGLFNSENNPSNILNQMRGQFENS